jgi:hypothetical protein
MKTQAGGHKEEQVPSSSAKTFEDTFKEIYDEAFQLLCDKQRRYGNSNIEQLGLHGVISRIGNDKIARAKKFLQGKVVDGQVILDPLDIQTDESLSDTLLDIANYALIAVALKRGVWGAPMREDVKKNAK